MKRIVVSFCLVTLLLSLLSLPIYAQGVMGADKYNTDLRPFKYNDIWRGEKKDTLFPSKVMGYEKNISIFTPDKFGNNPDETYPLIIFFDRHNSQLSSYILHSIDMLESYGQIPRPVVVGIEAGRLPGLRKKEAQWNIDGPESHGEKIDQFIFDELIPYVCDHYRIDENQIIVYGHSWFGYHSSMLLVNHIPDLFAIISASPCCLSSERIDEIVQGIANSASRDRKFFYRVASGHDIGDNLDVYRELTGKISIMRKPEMFDYKTTWLNAAMHMEVPPLLFIQSLYEIYADWADLAYAYADPANHPTFDDARLYDSLQQISDEIYGFRIPIYDRHLEMRVEYYRYIRDKEVSNKGKIATWKFMIIKYGEKPELYYNIAETYLLLNQTDSAKEYLDKVKSFELNGELKEKVKELEKQLKH
jgi:enterochelin esterase-like enzyme